MTERIAHIHIIELDAESVEIVYTDNDGNPVACNPSPAALSLLAESLLAESRQPYQRPYSLGPAPECD